VRESMTAIVRGATVQLTARPSGTVTAWKTWLSPTFRVPAGDRWTATFMGASARPCAAGSSGGAHLMLATVDRRLAARVQAPFSTV